MTAADIQTYYQESFQFLQERKKRQVAQLVLLNNLNRGDQNIASTLLLSLFNRLLSNLYDDKMQIKFLPSQGINQEQLNSFNILAQSDYIEMGKSKIDYDWWWDTLFFGRGYLETIRFDKKRKILQPHVINPLVFGYDPRFENPQEWRYYWKWITKSKWELKKLIEAKVITGVKTLEEIPSGVDPYLWDYKVERDKASKAVEPPIEAANRDVFQLLEFYGYDKNGDKCVFWTDKGCANILMKKKLDFEDGEEVIAPNGKVIDMGSKWPIVIKESFRLPHASVPFSVADLLEDKHRAKNVLLNLAYIAAKDRANPLYGYNPDKIKDISQFFQRQINQHIPMEDADAVWPLNTEDPMSPGLLQFISMVTQEANEPMGTGQSLQPIAGKPTTATERAIDQQLNDMAQSLQSKVGQFGEADFWSHWFYRYKKYGPELKDKMANIVGVKGITSHTIDLSDFNTKFPPGVMVYSAKEAEYKELVLRRDLMELYPALVQTIDPDGMRNFNKFVFFPKFLQDPSLVDIIFPKTLDEMKAEEENESLKENKFLPASETDDHVTHIYIHAMIQPKTWAYWFHKAEHEEMYDRQKKEQMAMAQEEMLAGTSGKVSSSKVEKEKTSPLAAASPLKTETQNSLQSVKK